MANVLTLHRSGQFDVAKGAEDSTQCGFRRGDRRLSFDVWIESTDEYLDGNGFVLDNNAIMHYFADKYKDIAVFVSCERIACEAITDLRNLVGRERCYAIAVEIRPGDYAGIRASTRFIPAVSDAQI